MGRRYAVSDLHGRYDLWQGILEFIKPDDTIYFLGDANDRNSAGWKMIKEIYNHPQFVYLKGNHEDILVHALVEYLDQGILSDGYWYRMCMNNGGYQTFYDAIDDPHVWDWIKKIQTLPLEAEIETVEGKVYMCHSGNKYGNRKAKLWDREHFNWPVALDDSYIVHGHTPTKFLTEEYLYGSDFYDVSTYKKCKVCFYSPDERGGYSKVDIDVGAAWNDYIVLLDLDTFEVIKIYPPIVPELELEM